jgi:hypothetical protein
MASIQSTWRAVNSFADLPALNAFVRWREGEE